VKPLGISEPAAHELTEAVRWYEQRRPGWGEKLFVAVTKTLELILAHPEIGAPRSGRLPSRQLRVQGFPYKVAYRIREDDI
jgi:plasmid stabilization system protein ParE